MSRGMRFPQFDILTRVDSDKGVPSGVTALSP